MSLDLQMFAGNDTSRPYLNKPFTAGKFTYSTNGHIMVRLSKIDGVRKQEKDRNWDAPLLKLDEATFSPLAHGPLPGHPLGPCVACDGRGSKHDCPDCECGCNACRSTGSAYPDISTTVRGGLYNLRYVAMMLTLPGIQVADKTEAKCPLLFKFDGGVGAIMPRTKEAVEHIEIELAKAA